MERGFWTLCMKLIGWYWYRIRCFCSLMKSESSPSPSEQYSVAAWCWSVLVLGRWLGPGGPLVARHFAQANEHWRVIVTACRAHVAQAKEQQSTLC